MWCCGDRVVCLCHDGTTFRRKKGINCDFCWWSRQQWGEQQWKTTLNIASIILSKGKLRFFPFSQLYILYPPFNRMMLHPTKLPATWKYYNWNINLYSTLYIINNLTELKYVYIYFLLFMSLSFPSLGIKT